MVQQLHGKAKHNAIATLSGFSLDHVQVAIGLASDFDTSKLSYLVIDDQCCLVWFLLIMSSNSNSHDSTSCATDSEIYRLYHPFRKNAGFRSSTQPTRSGYSSEKCFLRCPGQLHYYSFRAPLCSIVYCWVHYDIVAVKRSPYHQPTRSADVT
jgi:hypothetical protein